jgi:hypothetical protein
MVAALIMARVIEREAVAVKVQAVRSLVSQLFR